MKLHRFLTLLAALLVILLMITVWLFPSNDDFQVENPYWNGTSRIADSYGVQTVSLAELPSPPQDAALILIPYLPYSSDEMEGLRDFLDEGGTLVLADDYGYGNQVLEYLGLEARFSGQTLLDPLLNYKNQNFPRVSLATDPADGNSANLVLNHATCLVNVDAADALAMSSSFSFLDGNDDGQQGQGEAPGPRPVISRHRLGEGRVILAADPSLFINGMEDLEGNTVFRQYIAAAGTLYIDQSHLAPSELHGAKSWLAGLRSFLATPLATAVVVVLLLALALRPLWHRRAPVPTGDTDMVNSQ